MLKVPSRAALAALAGTKPEAEKPIPVTAEVPPPAIDPGQIVAMQQAITDMAAGIERTAALVAQIQQQPAPAPAGPKQLEAVIHRNTRGLMERVSITVVK